MLFTFTTDLVCLPDLATGFFRCHSIQIFHLCDQKSINIKSDILVHFDSLQADLLELVIGCSFLQTHVTATDWLAA